MNTFTNYLIMLLESIIYYQLISYNLEFKYEDKVRVSTFGVFLLTLILRYMSYPNPMLHLVMNFLLYIVSFALPFFLYKGKIVKKFIITVIFLLIISINEIGTISAGAFILHKSFSDMKNDTSFILALICILIPLITIFVVRRVYRKHKIDLRFPSKGQIETLIILVSNIALIFLAAILWEVTTYINISVDIVLGFIMFLIVTNAAMTSLLLYKSFKRVKKQMEYNLKMQQMEMENRLNKDMTEVIENLRSLRHDMNNHFSILKGLLNLRQYDELNEYLDSIYKDIEISNKYVIINNPTLSILINSKISKTNNLNINFEPSVALKNFQMKDRDMCTLVGNIIENAIEACEKVTENKYIGFTMKEKGDFCIIQCENTYKIKPIKEGDEFITTKNEKEWHGIGLKNVYSIVKKYNGTVDIDLDSLFTIEIILPCN